jgi:hypothetical protein
MTPTLIFTASGAGAEAAAVESSAALMLPTKRIRENAPAAIILSFFIFIKFDV